MDSKTKNWNLRHEPEEGGPGTFWIAGKVLDDDGTVETVAELHGATAEDALLMAGAARLLGILEDILYAHDTDNNGAAMGEATLCHAYARRAMEAIRAVGGFFYKAKWADVNKAIGLEEGPCNILCPYSIADVTITHIYSVGPVVCDVVQEWEDTEGKPQSCRTWMHTDQLLKLKQDMGPLPGDKVNTKHGPGVLTTLPHSKGHVTVKLDAGGFMEVKKGEVNAQG